MLGILYITLLFLIGKEFVPKAARTRLFLVLPMSFGIGTLAMGWATYIVAYIASVYFGKENPLFYANMTVMGTALLFLVIVIVKRIGVGRKKIGRLVLQKNKSCFWEIVFFVIIFIFITWSMFYVFHVKDGQLYCGFSVFGDYAPHTAMMRSFSWGNNFPTQYPHFGGEDVKYHFMFQFLAGNLEYLGLRIDLAYNFISILSLGFFLMMLYLLAERITKQKIIGIVSIFLFFFRSGFAFFRFIWEHFKTGDLWAVLKENTDFIGYTQNENWGLWNYNVYLNQRHLAFGLLIVCIALWVYLDWVEVSFSHEEKGFKWLKNIFFSKEAWIPRNIGAAFGVGILLGLCAFWNGSAVIGGLLILAGFGLFSYGKSDYFLTALSAVLISFLQTKVFLQGGTVDFTVYWGFLAEDKSLLGVLQYFVMMNGIYFIGLIVISFFLKRKNKALAISFFIPLFFALLFSLTPDISVNHKYIMISYAFLAMFWAWAFLSLWKKRFFGKIVAVFLAVCITATGIYDFIIIVRKNDKNHRISVAVDSDLERWISQNLDKDDLMLTPEYSLNEVTMSGEMLYCGWPYYAWSAGYDTYSRAEKAKEIYTTDNIGKIKALVSQEGITYILFEEGMELEEAECREDMIAQAFPLVYESEDGRIRIYET